MRKPALAIALLLLVSPAAAEVQHQVYADTGKVFINSTVELTCSDDARTCPVNSWRLTWSKPGAAEVVSIRDSLGRIQDYQVGDSTVSIDTNSGRARRNETVEIRLLLDKPAEEVHSGLYRRTVSLPGFSGERTTGFVTSPDLVSGRTSFGFDSSFTGEKMVFRGSGPVNVRIKSGKGFETRYFSFFGSRVNGTETAYEVPVGTTGLVQGFRLFPVAVMEDGVYDSKVNEWSAGEYVGGAIQIRTPGSIGDRFLPVLAHEVVHGLNDRELNWDQTGSSYFDEGVAKYVEFLVHRKLYREHEVEEPPRELFGEEVRYDPDPRDRSYYTLPPKGDSDRLWSYYRDNLSFMKQWNAMDAAPENREFGYAYAELVIRNYVANGGSIRELYDMVDVDREVSDPEEKWRIYSRHLDMKPCSYESRDRFQQCLEKVNSHDYPVYSASPDHRGGELDIRQLKVPNRTRSAGGETVGGDLVGKGTGFRGFVSSFIDYIYSLIQALAASL